MRLQANPFAAAIPLLDEEFDEAYYHSVWELVNPATGGEFATSSGSAAEAAPATYKEERASVETRRAAVIASQIIELATMIFAFPHCDMDIAMQTAENWFDVGWDDAKRRTISHYDWLWLRSRYLAGHK